MLRHTIAALCLLCLCWFLLPLRAQTVTVDMQDVTIQDVLEELKEQTGYRFQTVGIRKQAGEEIVIPELKADDRPLREVLQTACGVSGYTFRRVQRTLFWIEQGDPWGSPHWADADGFTVAVESVSVSLGSRQLDFSRGAGQPGETRPGLGMTVVVEAPTDEAAARIHSLESLMITDDAGRPCELSAERYRHSLTNLNFHPTPDVAKVHVRFEDADLDAASIARFEGTLVLYKNLEPHELRFDDLSARDVTVREGGLEVTLKRATVGGRRCDIELATRFLEGVPAPDAKDWGKAVVRLVGQDGKTQTSEVTLRTSGSWSLSMGMPEGLAPTALTISFARRRYPDRKVPFTITDIPLPQ